MGHNFESSDTQTHLKIGKLPPPPSRVVDDGYRLPLNTLNTSPAGPYFLRSHAKQKSGIISAQLQEVG